VPDTRKVIRETLETIETVIRFDTIRLFSCYRAVLEHVLMDDEAPEETPIPDVELFLEIGASNRTMVSLIGLGLSRTVAIRLVGARQEDEPELGPNEALAWLESQSSNLDALGLSPLQVDEVREMLVNARLRDRQ
jgi:hypothetical protein